MAARSCTRRHPASFCMSLRPCTRAHLPTFCMSLRGAKRRGNPYSLQYHKTKRNTLGKYEKHDEFALSTTDLPGSSAGMRIATPVCALVRNDMLKEGRVRGCKDVPPPCHCYENKVGTFRKRAQEIEPEPGRVFSAGLCSGHSRCWGLPA